MNVSESIFDENIPLMMEKSKEEPVFIFGEDEPKYVLLSFEAYNALLDVGSDGSVALRINRCLPPQYRV